MNAIYNLTYNLFNALFPIISVAYISRVLTPSGVGTAAYVQNVASYFVALAPMGIPTYGQKVISQCNKSSKLELNQRFSELFIINSISTIAVLIAYYCIVLFIPFFSRNRVLYVIASLSIAINILNVDWFYRGMEEYRYITFRNFCIKILSFILVIIFVKNIDDLAVYLIIICGVSSLNNIINVVHLRAYVSFTTSIQYTKIKEHLKPIFYLLLSLIASDIYSKMDITMIGAMCSDSDVGYYSSAYKIVNMVLVIVTSITAVSLPALSKKAHEEKEDYKAFLNSLINLLIVFCSAACIGLTLISKELVVVFLGESFEEASTTLKILSSMILIKGIGDLVAYQHVVAVGRERILVPIRFISLFLNLVANYVFILVFGFNGAALATVLTELITLIYVVICMREDHYFSVNHKNVFSVICGCVFMMTSVIAVKHFFSSHMLTVLILSVSIGGIIYLFTIIACGNEIISFIKKK